MTYAELQRTSQFLFVHNLIALTVLHIKLKLFKYLVCLLQTVIILIFSSDIIHYLLFQNYTAIEIEKMIDILNFCHLHYYLFKLLYQCKFENRQQIMSKRNVIIHHCQRNFSMIF
jgi:hypothetical protein